MFLSLVSCKRAKEQGIKRDRKKLGEAFDGTWRRKLGCYGMELGRTLEETKKPFGKEPGRILEETGGSWNESEKEPPLPRCESI